jgi:peptide-methionine (S)-S-oxide reductase
MFIALNACGPSRSGAGEVGSDRPVAAAPEDHGGRDMTRAPAIPPKAGEDAAIFAGGCFWCMEAPFDKLEGVISTTSGFTGGQKLDPTYEEVSSGSTGHAESIRVVFDPKKISYEKLLEVYWHNIDPTQADGQFCDHGNQYRSAIFYLDEAQRKAAEASKKALEASGKLPGPIVTEIVPASTFYPAENYHQDFYKKDPIRYHSYRFGCGRDRRLEQLWGGSGH